MVQRPATRLRRLRLRETPQGPRGATTRANSPCPPSRLNPPASAHALLAQPNGDHFEGRWVEGKKEGTGVHFYFSAEKRVHSKRYDGEWVDDRPKCGVYTEMPPDPQVPASHEPEPLPHLELRDADAVVRERISQIRHERPRERARLVALEDHFTPEELEALRMAFTRVNTADSDVISLTEIGVAFNQVRRLLLKHTWTPLHPTALPSSGPLHVNPDAELQRQVGMEPTDEQMHSMLQYLGKLGSGAEVTFTFAEFAQAADFLSPLT